MNDKVQIGCHPTGVPGLDVLLGGGLSEFSFNVISGAPGTGKTTLAHQIMFSQASSERKALFFTVLGEPPLKMLRYQQQFAFFDIEKVDACIRYINLAEDLRTGDFSGVLERIVREVEAFSPGLVFVDSFRSVIQMAKNGNEGVADLQHFIQELGTRMTSWQATTFLIGEYAEDEASPVMTVADGMLSLCQDVIGHAALRKIRVVKMRGQDHMAGPHTFRMTKEGVHIYPRLLPAAIEQDDAGKPLARVASGVPGLDTLLGGGIPRGHAMMVVGPAGCGKTILSTAFLMQGASQGEHGVVAYFEKSAASARDPAMRRLAAEGKLTVIASRSLDMSIEEILHNLTSAVERTGATRVVIDSLSEFALYLAPEFRSDYRESVFRILAGLGRLGVTVLVTMGLDDNFTELSFSKGDTAFLVDAVVAMRYVEIEGQLVKVISAVKVRGSAHSTDLRRYHISAAGIEITGAPVRQLGLLSGNPRAAAQG